MWDCKYKEGKNKCIRLGDFCSPGKRGCVLSNRFVFSNKEEAETDKTGNKDDRSSDSKEPKCDT